MLAFKINRQISHDFARMDDLSVPHASSGHSFFSRYFYQLPESETDLFLLANKGTEGYLIPEMKNVDYFILIRNFIDQEDVDHLLGGLNRIAEVVVAAEVDPGKLKSKENLIF